LFAYFKNNFDDGIKSMYHKVSEGGGLPVFICLVTALLCRRPPQEIAQAISKNLLQGFDQWFTPITDMEFCFSQ
jgi:hypothetical protein